jgi:hypothetical protein
MDHETAAVVEEGDPLSVVAPELVNATFSDA